MRFRRTDYEASGIRGILLVPDGDGPFPAVVVSHGFGGTCRDNLDHAAAFASRGYLVCCIDFRGGSPWSSSGGDMRDMSVLTEAEDLEAVLDDIRGRPDVDPGRVFLFGESQGGFVSAYVAAEHPDEVRGLVLLYPAFVIRHDAEGMTMPDGSIPDRPSLFGMPIGRRYVEDALSFDIYDMLGSYRGPVLIMHGDRDRIVPIAYSERAVRIFPSAELVVMEGQGHGFSGSARERAEALALAFLDRSC